MHYVSCRIPINVSIRASFCSKSCHQKKTPSLTLTLQLRYFASGTSEAVIQGIQQTNIRFELRRPRRTLQPKNFRKVSKLRDPLTPLQVFFAQLHSSTGLQAAAAIMMQKTGSI